MSDSEIKKLIRIIFIIVILIVIVILVASVIGLFFFALYYGFKLEDLAQTGDYFGGILNPIFGFSAFLLLLWTIHIQTEELSLSRIEFTKTAKALKKQVKNQRQQIFENTFFHLLTLHNEIISNLQYVDPEITDVSMSQIGRITTGRDCFNKFSQSLNHMDINFQNKKGICLQNINLNNISENKKDRIKQIAECIFENIIPLEKRNTQVELFLENLMKQIVEKESYEIIKDNIHMFAYSIFASEYQLDLGHYFKNLFYLIKFVISNKNIDEKMTKFYINIIRAQLSTNELTLIFYNCLYFKNIYGKEKFYNIVEHKQVCLFKGMQIDFLLADEDVEQHYKDLYPVNYAASTNA